MRVFVLYLRNRWVLLVLTAIGLARLSCSFVRCFYSSSARLKEQASNRLLRNVPGPLFGCVSFPTDFALFARYVCILGSYSPNLANQNGLPRCMLHYFLSQSPTLNIRDSRTSHGLPNDPFKVSTPTSELGLTCISLLSQAISHAQLGRKLLRLPRKPHGADATKWRSVLQSTRTSGKACTSQLYQAPLRETAVAART